MPRIAAIDPATADGQAKALLDAVQAQLGMVPNLLRTLAQSPAALKAYLDLSAALSGGSLSAGEREQLALRVGQTNGCDYCLAAHSAIGASVGLSADQIADARQGRATDSRSAALLAFVDQVIENRGFVSDVDLAEARAQGLSDGDLLEVVGHVALNTLTNFSNHVADTAVDFPAAAPLAAV